jgi:predicted nucleic acid-binding protein
MNHQTQWFSGRALDNIFVERLWRTVKYEDIYRALRWAHQLGHSKAYDTHYLAVAEHEGIELWTAGRRLANGAPHTGVRWVHWVGEA